MDTHLGTILDMAYLFWLAIFVWLPLAVLWATHWSYLSRYWRTFLYCALAALIFSIPWDLWAVEMQIWFFPAATHLGPTLLGLPMEEYLFMVFVTLLVATFALVARKRIEAANPSGV